MFFFLLPWKHAYLYYSQHLRFKNIPSEISHDAIVIESFIFLLLSSFCPENSTFVQVFNKIGLVFTFLSTNPLKWDLERITISPTRIPFPVLGHIYFLNMDFSLIMALICMKICIQMLRSASREVCQNFDIGLSFCFMVCRIRNFENKKKKITKVARFLS